MFFLNLSLMEFLALASALSAFVVALYLLDRSRRRQTVATFRFWNASALAPRARRRRWIQQPWSLLLQLISVLLLLAALAGLRWGSPARVMRDHVIILDTSAWMAARGRNGSLLDEAKAAAAAYVRALPSSDRVMIVRAEATATPATSFLSDRAALAEAIRQTRAGATSLSLDEALQVARQAQRLEGRAAGSIVYAGAGRISKEDAAMSPAADGLRLLPVSEPADNCGLRGLSLRRSESDPGLWEIFVRARNYGRTRCDAPLTIQFGGALIGTHRFVLAPGEEQNATFRYRTRAAGWIEARLRVTDALEADNHAELEVPAQPVVRVLVYSEEPDLLRPVLRANPNVEAVFARPRDYDPNNGAGVVILDRFGPAVIPDADTIWIEPPPGASPFEVRATVKDARLERWHAEHVLGAGLGTRDLRLDEVQVFSPAPGDLVVAECADGPVIVARPGRRRAVALGFHPGRAATRFDLATPLLFANLLGWLAPDVFRQRELASASVGMVTATIDPAANPADIRVVASNGRALPFTTENGSLRFFTATPGSVQVLDGNRTKVFSLTLPDVADARWEPPAETPRGLPGTGESGPSSPDLWPWLAVAGALGLFGEWMRFGPRRRLTAAVDKGAGMSFEHAWVLLFAILPAAWLAWQWHRAGRRTLLVLKLLAILCVLVALAEPGLRVARTRMAVAILVDTSQSVAEQDLARASQLVAAMEKERGRHWVRVVPFARSARQAYPEELASNPSLRHTSGEAGEATDLEAALREALTTMPAGLVPRIALISDGKENRGSVARAATLLQRSGVPVDTFALAGRLKPGLEIETVTLPAAAFTGERFAIDLVVRSPRRATGVIEVAAEGKRIGANPVTMEAGENRLRIHASISQPGAIAITGVIRLEGLNETRFGQALTLRRPKLLYISGDPPGWEEHLLATLRAAQFDIEISRGPLPPRLDDFQLVVFDNWDLEALPAARKTGIEEYVKQGGGLLVIGGERNVYRERKTNDEDPLERAMPAKLAPPRSPEDRCVVLVLDKSASMSGRKIEMARLAAVGIIENMRPTDFLGVLIFDNSFRWAAPIRRVEDGAELKQLVAGIESDGGTQIWPALAEAYAKLVPVNATYKHILLLTDGISEAGDSLKLAEQAGLERITISTVGLGKDINQPYLEKLAALANGKSYVLPEPTELEQILLRDVEQHTGWTAVEKNVQASVLRKVELLEGVDMETAPPLKGYVRFIAKPTTETILQIDGQDPLLARWQYGLGQSIVFASDAKSRWAEGWVTWGGFDRFWANVARDLLPHSQASEATVEYDRANRELVVDYRLSRQVEAPRSLPDVFAFGPDGFQRPVEVHQVAEGAYRGRVSIADRAGFFRVRPLAESRVFPELGFYRATHELRDYGSDELLLRRVAAFTGGRFNPRPRQVFDTGGRVISSTMQLWPGLLGLAILLNLAELVLRKWRGVFETLWARRLVRNAG